MIETKLAGIVPQELERRVQAFADTQGASLIEVVQAALEEYLEEADDVAFAKRVAQRLVTGQESLHSKDEVWAELDELQD